MSNNSEKVKDYIIRNLGYIVAIILSAVYIAAAIVKIDDTGKTVSQIIADSAIAFFLSILINRAFDLQGIMIGDRDERVIKTLSVHGETVDKISPHIDELDAWCKIKNAENLRQQRVRILATEGLKYSDYFNEDGSAKELKIDRDKLNDKAQRRAERRRIFCYNKALRVKLTPLSANELISEGAKANDQYNFGQTKEKYEKNKSISDIIMKAGIAIIFGYYTVALIDRFSYAVLIWRCLQVCTFLIIGTISMIKSYMFVTDSWRGRIVKKTNSLEMFYNYVTSDKKKGDENNG